MREALEDIFYQAKVDLVVNGMRTSPHAHMSPCALASNAAISPTRSLCARNEGHVHSYERALPVYRGNPTADAPVYITNGVGGNGLDESWGTTPVWSAQR
jgi:hypothetical protein